MPGLWCPCATDQRSRASPSSISPVRRAAWIVLCSGWIVTGAVAADLTVEVTGHQSSDGTVRVALYGDSKSFPQTPLRGVEGAALHEPLVLSFKDVAPGVYALTAYHDENDNKKMDRGLFGIPSERYGFSRDARGDKGPPEFRDAQIEVRDPSAKISIKLR